MAKSSPIGFGRPSKYLGFILMKLDQCMIFWSKPVKIRQNVTFLGNLWRKKTTTKFFYSGKYSNTCEKYWFWFSRQDSIVFLKQL